MHFQVITKSHKGRRLGKSCICHYVGPILLQSHAVWTEERRCHIPETGKPNVQQVDKHEYEGLYGRNAHKKQGSENPP